jgi:ParB-like chromosome segregation protein Spo0J
MPRTKSRKKVKYEPVLELPPLSSEEYEGLRSSILVSGVLVPIFVDCDGPVRRIIDGNYRKKITDDLGYDCPEIVVPNLTDEELRAMARALNLARRQLTTNQKRAIIADQLAETPERSNRWVGKMLGVSHPTVASVKAELAAGGKVFHLGKSIGLLPKPLVFAELVE